MVIQERGTLHFLLQQYAARYGKWGLMNVPTRMEFL
jgi:hypothetical protein